jgi:hypothetical protein
MKPRHVYDKLAQSHSLAEVSVNTGLKPVKREANKGAGPWIYGYGTSIKLNFVLGQ